MFDLESYVNLKERYERCIIAERLFQQIWRLFQNKIKENELVKHIPEYNAKQINQANKECFAFMEFLSQQRLKNHLITEDKMPTNIPNDNITCFHIHLENTSLSKIKRNTNSKFHSDSHSEIINQTKYSSFTQKQQNTLIYSETHQISQNIITCSPILTNFSPKNNKVTEFKAQSSNSIIQKSLNQKKGQTNKNQMIALNLNPNVKLGWQSSALQHELQHIRNHFQNVKKYQKKCEEEEQKANMEKLSKKKLNLLKKNKLEHTYEYDGSQIDFKKSSNRNSFVKQLQSHLPINIDKRKLSSIRKRNTKNNSINSTSIDINSSPSNPLKLIFSSNSNLQRKNSSLQKQENQSFSNANNRQLSHLPFIILKENSKIIQNEKYLSGSNTERKSLHRMTMSNSNSEMMKFKSFAYLEQEKKLDQTIKNQIDFSDLRGDTQLDILPPTLSFSNSNSQVLPKQSRMMRKYLKKITDQKSKIEKMIQKESGLKSLNFQHVAVAQKYPIRRYYEYDYQSEKRNHECSISSKMSTKWNSINATNYKQPN